MSVEQLRTSECNYLNRLTEVVAIVGAVDHPNVRVLADLFHMAVMGASPADLDAARRRGGRFPAVLRLAPPRITIGANGTPEQLATGFATIRRQAADVVSGRPGA